MTAMGMQMAMAHHSRAARAKYNNDDGNNRPGPDRICLTKSEIDQIRIESAGTNNEVVSRVNTGTSFSKLEDDDLIPMPKCSSCCIMM